MPHTALNYVQASPSSSPPWTFDAYHAVLADLLVRTLTDEIKRQENAYDAAKARLMCEAEEEVRQFERHLAHTHLPGSEEYERLVAERVSNAHDARRHDLERLSSEHALATLDPSTLGALGPHVLLDKIKVHMARIEHQRRAMAATAADGRDVSVPLTVPWRMSVKREGVVNDGGGKSVEDAPPSCRDSVPPSSPVKREPPDHDAHGSGNSTASASEDRVGQYTTLSASVCAVSSLAQAGAKAEAPHDLLDWRPIGHTEISSGLPPSWVPWKSDEVNHSEPVDRYDGAYMIPHGTPPGAPFARYVSSFCGDTSSRLRPTLVAALAPHTSAPDVSAPRKRNASRSPSGRSKRRHRTQPVETSVGETEERWLLPHHHRRKTAMGEGYHRRIPRVSDPSSPFPLLPTEGDRVMRLWWRVWPWSSSETGEAGSQQSLERAAFSSHRYLRPTLAMVEALRGNAQQNYHREMERLVAQEQFVEGLLAMASDQGAEHCVGDGRDLQQQGEGVAILNTEGWPMAPQEPTIASSSVSSPSPSSPTLSERWKLLKEQKTALDREHARRCELLDELADILCFTSSMAISSLPEANRAMAAPRASGKKPHHNNISLSSRDGPSMKHRHDKGQEGHHSREAVSHTLQYPVETLRCFFAHPRRLLRRLTTACDADIFWSVPLPLTTGPPPPPSPSFGASRLPHGIEEVTLPTLEYDRDAADLAQYLWPHDLDSRIRHELNAYVRSSSDAVGQSSHHVMLSSVQAQKLEENAVTAAGALEGVTELDPDLELLSVVPPSLVKHVMKHPKVAIGGWLYIEGRGELLAADVQLT